MASVSREPDQAESIFRGIGVSPGVCQGPAIVVGPRVLKIPEYRIESHDVAPEVQRFKQALVATREELQKIKQELSQRVEASEAGIFESHMLVLEDQAIIDEVVHLVEKEQINVALALDRTAQKYISALEAVKDDYLRERASDLRDIAFRVHSHLLSDRSDNPLDDLQEPSIIIGHDLSPSMTALFDRETVLGFATDVGSPTSHTTILARSLQLPAVVGLHDASHRLKSGQPLLLDGYGGAVILHPSKQTLYEYGNLQRHHRDFADELTSLRELPGQTLDSETIRLMANIDHPKEVGDVDRFGAEGVGLFRTEYLFLNCTEFPDEERQYQTYRQVAADLERRPLIIRTLDLGTDKMPAALTQFEESNPALGVRAIRFCLQHQDMFKCQLRAILRASVHGQIYLLYPLISSIQELRDANQLLETCRQELQRENLPFDEKIKVGVMIETPAAAMIADALAREVDFFSIGTNDLIQYGAAVDRTNERVAHLYEPTHPGILRLIRHTIQAGRQADIPVGLCGEMAGYPTLVPLLIGLGIRHLSTSAPLIPTVKHLVRKLKLTQAQELAEQALAAQSGGKVMEACREFTARIAPELDIGH